jgi:phosphate uptake regulator/aminoglycoside phosphotransferase
MITFEGLEENFKFLTVEVQKQVRSSVAFLDSPTHELYDRIISRDDYIDSLKTIIENKCYSQIHTGGKPLTEGALHRIRAIQVISVNLERIADFCVNIVRQVGYLTDHAFLHNYDHEQMFSEIESCIAHILDVLESANLSGALAICKSEHQLDMLYKTIFDRIMDELRNGQNVQNLITVLFIFRYLERIGDSLLNIGEALMFVIIGERIKIEQFEALQQTLTKTGFEGGVKDIDFKSIMGTRSGCRIGKVDQKANQNVFPEAFGCIYKEGALGKISAERDNLSRWAAVFPGLVANVVSYNEDADKASMLVEFLPGCNFDELVLSGDIEVLQNAMFILTQTARHTWEETFDPTPIPTTAMQQLRSRLDSIHQIHPDFSQPRRAIGDLPILATEELLRACEELEQRVFAPFSVFIHGDFNTSNFIYDHAQQRIHYIDVYRSKQYDYVQDVSVFILSNFRIPIFEPHIRERLDAVIEEFYLFAREFAASKQDASFDYRLALALARSFATSTRFELNRVFAREMFARGRYLLEKVLLHADRPLESFSLPTSVFYY